MSLNILNHQHHRPLPVGFYERDPDKVAVDLIGQMVVRRALGAIMVGRIVEVEAYFGEGDPASHACRGMTPRNAIMFGRAGMAYVYLNYGVHCLLNVVTGLEGRAGAVLIRALEPVSGIETMVKNRPVKRAVDLTSGPGKLTKALGIDLADNGVDMTVRESRLYIANGEQKTRKVIASPRIGISKGEEMLLRFHAEGSPFVSKQ
ncbi:MAG TPA: DNA-3-methyladenine glycosylase [Actinobacteria bacterium]|nr:DNA-3-methyladenine glycosylase [Actinomycetota bacterium]